MWDTIATPLSQWFYQVGPQRESSSRLCRDETSHDPWYRCSRVEESQTCLISLDEGGPVSFFPSIGELPALMAQRSPGEATQLKSPATMVRARFLGVNYREIASLICCLWVKMSKWGSLSRASGLISPLVPVAK